MDPARAARIDQLLEHALDLPAPERRAWLDEACRGDASLLAAVERLVGYAASDVEDLVEQVQSYVAATEAEEPGALAAGETVGAYTVAGTLGQGGMGVVYLAERSDAAFRRRVALKVLPNARSTPAAIRRFEQERHILARLDHPRIARLLDGGLDPRGLPFLVLEHVEGEPIDRWCDRRQAGLEERLRLVVAIAGAVQAAHQRLIVHRDLKPSNLLVTAEGEVKLLDFGIAKLLAAEGDDPGLTATGTGPMTPTYASPEQVNAEPITTASDVYQLGLVAYELVTGVKPQATQTESLSELVELVCRREAGPASRAVMSGEDAALRAERRGSSPQRLARRCRPDLDAILGRALAKEPARRYASAADFARDLERFLAGEPVEARPAPRVERWGKWARRNPALAAVSALAVVSTVGYALAVTLQARAIERQRVRAELEAKKASEVERFVLGLFESSDPEQALGRDVPASELLRLGTERVERELGGEPEVEARLLSSLGAIYGEIGQPEKARELLERALAAQKALAAEEALAGVHRLEIATSELRLGRVLRRSRRFAEARSLLEAALAGHRVCLSEEAPEVARVLAELGTVASELGELGHAEESFTASLAIHRRQQNEGGIAIGLNNLASVKTDRGDLEGAAALYREALARERRRFGDGHPRVALPLFNLGLILRRLERPAEARLLLEEAWTIHRQVYGPGHPTTLLTEMQLASALVLAGQLERAEVLLGETLAALRGQAAPEDRRRTSAELWWGRLRLAQGRVPEAEAALSSALARRPPPRGRPDWLAQEARLWLGQSLAVQGRGDEAFAVWKQGLEPLRPGRDDWLIAKLQRAIDGAAGTGVGSP